MYGLTAGRGISVCRLYKAYAGRGSMHGGSYILPAARIEDACPVLCHKSSQCIR